MSKDMTKVLDSGVGKYVWRREYMMEEQGEREREGGREGGRGRYLLEQGESVGVRTR